MSTRIRLHSHLRPWLVLVSLLTVPGLTRAQAVPSPVENVPHLVTFGAQGDAAWGDDDHCQVFFFLVPKQTRVPLYIRVFDPDTGGQLDEKKGAWNTTVTYTVYGGVGAHSEPDAQATNPRGNFRRGNQLASQAVSEDADLDGRWLSLGPLDPLQGELVPEFDGYVFKVIAQGTTGDDGNLYSYFLSTSAADNVPVEGGNAFTYEYAFRLPAVAGARVHLYPFVARNVVSVKQSNFDADSDGQLRVFSVARNGQPAPLSGDNTWASSELVVDPREKGLSLDLEYTKKGTYPNDVVFYVTDQYDKALPFFAIPLGGKPKYHYNVDIRFK